MNIETRETGERAAKPGLCFYCDHAVGADHAPDCVVLQRTVVLEMKVRYVASVPRYWSKDDIEFHRNDGSFCLSNDLAQLCKEDETGCLCDRAEVAFVREATKEDHHLLNWEADR